MWAETIIKILANQIKYIKKINKIKKRKLNAKIIIFTRCYDLNKKWLKKEPKIVNSVTPTFIELTEEFKKLFRADITDLEKL
jgi:tRNA A37 threonylcarbamoyladenosine synthetase subunit TsaC/SUA5/YrdC